MVLTALWHAPLLRRAAPKTAPSAWHTRGVPKDQAESLAASSARIQWPRACWSGWSVLYLGRVESTSWSREELARGRRTACTRPLSVRVTCSSMSSSCFFHEPIHPPLDLSDQSDTIQVECLPRDVKESALASCTRSAIRPSIYLWRELGRSYFMFRTLLFVDSFVLIFRRFHGKLNAEQKIRLISILVAIVWRNMH